jgi:hypothetical protein
MSDMETVRTMKPLPSALLLAPLLLAAPLLALADAGPYLYAGYGQTRHDNALERSNLETDLRAMSGSPQNVTVVSDVKDVLARMAIGWRLSNYVALEAGFVKIGDYSLTASVNDAAVVDSGGVETSPAKIGRFSHEARARGAYSHLILGAPLGHGVTVLAKGGVVRTLTYYSCSGSSSGFLAGQCGSGPSRLFSNNLTYGIGVQYDMKPFSLRLDFERIENLGLVQASSEGDVDLATLGIVIRY